MTFEKGDNVRMTRDMAPFYYEGLTGEVLSVNDAELVVRFTNGDEWYVYPEDAERINAVNGVGPAGKSPRDYLEERMELYKRAVKMRRCE